MPGLDGIGATRQLTESGTSRSKIIILTTYELDEYLFDALQAGASGFLPHSAGDGDPHLVGTGLTNAQIAASVFISENTVKTHVARVFDKLGIHERVQAVIFAYDTGLVAPNTAPDRP